MNELFLAEMLRSKQCYRLELCTNS